MLLIAKKRYKELIQNDNEICVDIVANYAV
jgi:hypothetical protein